MRKIYLIAQGGDIKDIVNVLRVCATKIKNKSIRRNDSTDKYNYWYSIMNPGEEFQEKIIIKKEKWELLFLELEKVLVELKNSENRLNEIKNLINLIKYESNET